MLHCVYVQSVSEVTPVDAVFYKTYYKRYALAAFDNEQYMNDFVNQQFGRAVVVFTSPVSDPAKLAESAFEYMPTILNLSRYATRWEKDLAASKKVICINGCRKGSSGYTGVPANIIVDLLATYKTAIKELLKHLPPFEIVRE